MPLQSINTLKNWFSTFAMPTEAQFHDWLDSFWHKSDVIPATAIGGLQDLLDGKADVSAMPPFQEFHSTANVNFDSSISDLFTAPISEQIGATYKVRLAIETLQDVGANDGIYIGIILNQGIDLFNIRPPAGATNHIIEIIFTRLANRNI